MVIESDISQWAALAYYHQTWPMNLPKPCIINGCHLRVDRALKENIMKALGYIQPSAGSLCEQEKLCQGSSERVGKEDGTL